MKKTLFALYIIISFSGLFLSCNDNDKYSNDAAVPEITLSADEVYYVPGREFTIEATITDDVGLQSVYLYCEALDLDDLVTFGRGRVTDFQLRYPFFVPTGLSTDGMHEVIIEVTDLSGKKTEKILTVRLDGDIDAPVFLKVPQARLDLLSKENLAYTLQFEMQDNKQLGSLHILCTELSIDKEIPLSGTSAVHNEPIELGSGTGTYNFIFTLKDVTGLQIETRTTILVGEMPDFAEMYLADVFTDPELNEDEFGIPVIMDKKTSYLYELLFWSNKAGKEIMFIPQPTSMKPHCFGFDEGGNFKYSDDPEAVNKIVLAEKAYYRIKINIKEGTYSAIKETPTMQTISPLFFVGEGIVGRNNWWLDYPLTILDPDNPYEVYDEIEFGASASFAVSTSSWEPTWVPRPIEGHNVIFAIRNSGSESNCYPPVGKFRFQLNYMTGRAILKRRSN